jgi:lysylphosphatidylglycerol synthetase-like protein (DUF2156 family)
MGVYFRTGERSGVSVSWWFYLFAVLPLQLLYAMAKAVLYIGADLLALLVIVSRFARDRWQRRRAAA